MKQLVFCTLFAFSAALSAGNLIRNSSFELGASQFGASLCMECTDGTVKDPGPAFVIDTTTSTQGKASLKLDLKEERQTICWAFCTHEFSLQPGKTYTFSFDAKSDKAGARFSFACVSNQYFWQWFSWRNFRISPEWTRYSMTVKIPELKGKQTKYNEKFWMVLKNGEGTVWFDALKFTEGDSSVWEPAAPCESAVFVPRLLVEKDTLPAKVSAVSYGKDCSWSANVKLDLSSPKKKIAEKKVDFTLKKDVVETKEIEFKNIPYGGFHITSIPGVVEHSFARVHENNAVFGPGYQLGLISGMLESFGESRPPREVKLYWKSVYGKPGEFGKMLRLSGITWNNQWASNNGMIGILQPQPGKFDWFRTDMQLANAKKLKLKPTFAIATQSLLVKRGDADQGGLVPQWLRNTDRFGKPEGATHGIWGNFKIVLPPPQVVADHVKAIVQRYPDEFEYFLLFGEFNGYMTKEMIIEYAKAVKPVIEKYSPKTKFIAYNPTGDFNGKVSKTYEELMKLGAGKYTHGYSFHPYDSQMDDSPQPAQEAIRAMKKAFRKANADKELWNTEVFYLQKEWNFNYESSAITRRLAIDMGEGVRASSPLYYPPLFDNNLTPLCDFDNTVKEPNAKFAAYNAAGYFLNGAVPVKTHENNNVLGYTYRKDGKFYTVLWSRHNKTFITIPGNPKIYDFCGNVRKGKLERYAVGREPVFLEWGKNDPAKQMQKAVFAGLNDFTPSDLKRVPEGIGLKLRNESGEKMGGFLRLVSPYLEGKTALEFAPFEGETTVVVPVKVKANAPATFPVKLILTGRDRVFTVTKEFCNVPVLKLNQTYQGDGYDFTLNYKNGVLTVKVSVPDCTRKSSKNVWDGDCIEIYVDADPLAGDSRYMSMYHPGVSQTGIPLAKNGKNVPVTELHVKRGVKAAVSDGVKAVVTIPVKSAKGYIGFNIAVGNNGKHRAFRGKYNFKDRSNFSILPLNAGK